MGFLPDEINEEYVCFKKSKFGQLAIIVFFIFLGFLAHYIISEFKEYQKKEIVEEI